MENNFYVGVIYHCKKLFKSEYTEKLVLYSDDGTNYLDVLNNMWYTTNENDKDYVIKSSLIVTDISQYKIDYRYVLFKNKENGFVKKKTNKLFFNR